jgi:adenylate cyclase
MARRLTAILSADVVGYSRLMEIDEAGTLERLKSLRRVIVDPPIAAHGGRIVKLMGDGALVEFGSVVDAVDCALQIQRAMIEAEPNLADEQRVKFRIGINLGDVIVEGEDIYGDGVNVAARLQSLASPGGIAVSGTVREHVGSKLAIDFDDFGEHTVKNIERPVRVYMARIPRGPRDAPAQGRPARKAAEEKPTIAVLPFNNMSGDPEQEYFSDGVSEDIITDLSKVSALAVIARNTAFTFKGKAVRVEQVAKDLNVNYVLEGSVRKAGGRVRITAQLIRGADNFHVWAERYDRNLDDIFALQDEVSKSIVDALKVKLLPSELETITNRSTDNPEAYQALLMARSFFNRGNEVRSLKIARQLFARAIEIDPGYARAYAGLADCDSFLLLANDPIATYDGILANSTRALEIQPGLADAHASRGLALYIAGRHSEAEAEFEQAIALDGNSFEGHFFYGRNCFTQGRFDKAEALFKRAAALSPDDYRTWGHLQMIHVSQKRVDDAKEAARQGLQRVEKEVKAHPDNASALCFGAILLAEIGEVERALSWATRAEMFVGDDILVHYNLGCCYAKLAKSDQAMQCLERQLAASPQYNRWSLSWMKQDSDLDSLRSDPRFLDLIARMEAQVAEDDAGR